MYLVEGVSFLLLMVLSLSVWVCENKGVSYKRGFFCNDEGIRLPYKAGSVPSYAVVIISSSFLVIVIVCEAFRMLMTQRNHASQCLSIQPNIGKILKSPWVLRMFKILKWYVIGLMVTIIVTDVGKMAIGRLRPHFLDACRPDFALFNCTDTQGFPAYVRNVECQGDPEIVSDARLSWPSGHSSIAAFFSVFLAAYLSSLPILSVLRVLLTLLSLMTSFLIGLSRVLDNKHHPTDVLSGWVIGVAVATAMVYSCWATFHSDLEGKRNLENLASQEQEHSEADV